MQQPLPPLRKKRANAGDRSTFLSGYSFDTSVHPLMCAAVRDDVKLEIDNYKAEPTIDTDDEPLEYWKVILSCLFRLENYEIIILGQQPHLSDSVDFGSSLSIAACDQCCERADVLSGDSGVR